MADVEGEEPKLVDEDATEEVTEAAPAEAEEGEEGEKEPEVEEVNLEVEQVSKNLSLLCKTGDGLSHAYTKLTLSALEPPVTNIKTLERYIHIRYLDIAGNKISDLSPLDYMPHLLTLNADNNALEIASLAEHAYLQNISLVNNRLISTEGLNHPSLEVLNLSNNELLEVSGLNPSVLVNLHTIELRGNKLTSTAGLGLPSLKKLYLAGNEIYSVVELEKMSGIQVLHMRDNKLESLDGFITPETTSLSSLNLRGNQIQSLEEVKKLKGHTMLRNLTLLENPVCEVDEYRLEILLISKDLIKLDKEEYLEEERRDAEQIAAERAQIEEAAAMDANANENEEDEEGEPKGDGEDEEPKEDEG